MHLIPTATVLDIQRMSTEDGPGLRTTLFLKGCNLHCAWCHNPESIGGRPIVQWNRARCIGCQSCREICEHGALRYADTGIFIAAESCTLCLACIKECPSGALNVKGEDLAADRILVELLKDKAYYGEEGGVTISGGEPLLQLDAVLWLLETLKNEGLHTALDTAGLVKTDHLLRALLDTDLLLYDIKIMNEGEHRKYTGSSNTQVLNNLVEIAPYIKEGGKKLWIRTPVIPGATDSKENIAAIAAFLSENVGDAVERWELCAFNNLCRHKYESLGWDWAYKDTALVPETLMEEVVQLAAKGLSGKSIEVYGTGTTSTGKE